MKEAFLWTVEEITKATGGVARGNWQANGVSIDSRQIAPGDMFIALKGPQFDGHAYIHQAFAQGAVGVVVEQVPDGLSVMAPLVQVENTEQALTSLGAYGRSRSDAKIVGITGSVGKTSTRSMMALALEAYGRTHATQGNLNNHLGLPLTLARMPAEAAYGVIEMGMNHAREIAPLSVMARPHIAIITTVEAVHLEHFDSVEGIAEAKAEIFEGMRGGHTLLNYDNPYYALLRERAEEAEVEVISFGTAPKADIRLLSYRTEGWSCVAEITVKGKAHSLRLGQPGEHFVRNALAVLGSVQALGLPLEPALAALVGWGAEAGRGKPIALNLQGKPLTLLDDSYNASPASIRAALALLATVPHPGRTLVALGDMLELGDAETAEHQGLASAVQASGATALYTAGKRMKHLHDAVPASLRGGHGETADALLPLLEKAIQAGDRLLIKGSHGSGMWKLAAALKEKYQVKQSDQEVPDHAV